MSRILSKIRVLTSMRTPETKWQRVKPEVAYTIQHYHADDEVFYNILRK